MILPKADKLRVKTVDGPLDSACHVPAAVPGIALQNGKGGYPMLHFRAKIDGAWKNILRSAHIVFYTLANGPTPKGMVLDHLCRNRKCCNPDHLEPVTPAENVRRGVRTKLSHESVAEIKRLVASGASQSAVAKMFNVHNSHVSRVVRGQFWCADKCEAWEIVKRRRVVQSASL